MSRDIIRIVGGITARVAVKRGSNYDIVGSFGKYAFRATVYDTRVECGIMGSRIASLEMWRAKKTISGYIKIMPILCCENGCWTTPIGSKNDYNASCALIYKLDLWLPKIPK
jgi:predicted LPLAT superfamily acyltransferase